VLYVDLDFSAFFRALTASSERANRSMQNMLRAADNLGRAFARAKEVHVSGLEARVYVRAGMDPDYATPADLHRLVRLLLRRPHVVVGLESSMFLDRPARLRLAVAALRGWAAHRA
jgi:hypothetical protein